MIRKIRSGEVEELSCFPVGNATKPRRGRKKGSTTARKQDENMKLAVRRLAQSINCNFGAGDIQLVLKYSEERLQKLIRRIREDGVELSEDSIRQYAISEMIRFLRCVKRDMKKRGEELRYIAVTSDIDGETGEIVKVHHHLVLPASAFDFVFKHWPREFTNYTPMDNRKDHTAHAVYMLRQVRRQPDAKKYTTSKNLKKPVVVSEEIITVREEIRPPRGAKVMHRDQFDNDRPTQYMRYIVPPKKQKRGGKRE